MLRRVGQCGIEGNDPFVANKNLHKYNIYCFAVTILRQATRRTFCLSMIMTTTIITIFINLILHHAPSVFPGRAAVSGRGSAQWELISMLTYSCLWGCKEKKKKNMTNNWSTTKDVRTCSLGSQIFFTVKMANRQESKTRITQLHNHIFIYLNKKEM